MITLEDARAIARRAHSGKVDLLGVDYMDHVEAVAAGLIDFGLDLQIAAMLHDVVEDSDMSIDDLRAEGVSERSLAAVALVSRNLHPELDYAGAIELVAQSPDAVLVKISDNAHNSLPERIEALRALGKAPKSRYAEARRALYAVAERDDVKRILRRANSSLLDELPPA
jgi:(p)ppGpp synthase/HD superfamily hydrolase